MTLFSSTLLSTVTVYIFNGLSQRSVITYTYYRCIDFHAFDNYRVLTETFTHASIILDMLKKVFAKLFENKRRETRPRDFEWEKFQKTAKEQFVKLRDKGLSIPVVTL